LAKSIGAIISTDRSVYSPYGDAHLPSVQKRRADSNKGVTRETNLPEKLMDRRSSSSSMQFEIMHLKTKSNAIAKNAEEIKMALENTTRKNTSKVSRMDGSCMLQR
jgi:hypothetical protein